jgi:hypothetical protein
MRFNCGPSLAERAIMRAQRRNEYLEQWHPFFCLLPRRIGRECVWLEWIQRKGRQGYCGYSLEWFFEYRIKE